MSTTYYIAYRKRKKECGESDDFCGFSSSPLNDALYKELLVTVKPSGVFWHKCEVEGVLLNSTEQLIKFFSKRANQEKYSMEDENGRVCTLNELMNGLCRE